MKSRRLLLIASLPLAVAVITGVLAMLPAKPGVTKTNLDRIRIGMTQAEVEQIFGEDGDEVRAGFRSAGEWVAMETPRKMFVWYADGWSTAYVWFEENRVVEAEWHDSNETVFAKIRRWLHLR